VKSAYSVHRPVANLYLVRERDRRLRRELLQVVALVLPLVAGVLVYVWISHGLLEIGYRLRELELELDRLAQEERALQVETSHLARHERIEGLALERLGMQPATLEQVVFAAELR
jgi:cell division protein FtsL